MSDAARSIADKLIAAAYKRFGHPPEAGGEYIATVITQTDVLAYFLQRLQLAKEPRTRELFERLEGPLQDLDADMVMRAGLDQLAEDVALPETERQAIRAINEFAGWELETGRQRDRELNELAALDAEKYLREKHENKPDE